MADNLIKSIGPIDDLPLFQLCKEVLKALPGKAVTACAAVANGAMDAAGAAFDSVKSTAIGAVALGGAAFSREPSIEVARERAPAQEVPTVTRTSNHEVSITELGSFSPPTFSSASIDTGISR
jgi:hypothetical protein